MRRFPKASDVRATARNARTSQRESPIIIPKDRHAHHTPLRAELVRRRARKVNAGQYRYWQKTFPRVAPCPARQVWTGTFGLVQRLHGANHIDVIPRPRPEERALARASRRTATGETASAAILRDGRAKSAASSG